MAAQLEEITAIYLGESIRFDAKAAVCQFRPANSSGNLFEDPPGFEAKIEAEEGELQPSLSYRLYGKWENYWNKRLATNIKQFSCKTWIKTQPHGQAGIIKYLCKAPNIGPAIAQKLWVKFAGDAVRILRESPDVAATAVGGQLSEERAKEASIYLQTEARLEDVTIELTDLLAGHGFPKNLGKKCIKKWGNNAAEIVKRNPFLLMKFRGCGFKLCDQLYMKLGHHPLKLKRLAYCVWYALSRDREGHTWLPVEEVERGLHGQIGSEWLSQIRDVDVRAIRLAVRSKLVAARRDERERLFLAEGKRADQEQWIAERVEALSSRRANWPDLSEIDVSDHQREQAAKALDKNSRVAVLGGRPGTGKTYTTARLVKKLVAKVGCDRVAVCAPTGKAAVRLSQAMEEYGLSLPAMTIHRLLGVANHEEGEDWGFQHDEDDPLPVDYVIVDEGSMVDTSLMSSLLRAVSDDAHVLIVGDVNQLAPVGHGAPLRDLIAAEIPYGELREIQRNSGTIVRACSEIVDTGRFRTDQYLSPEDGLNLKMIDAGSPSQTIEKLLAALAMIRERDIADPVWDCQVICPINIKSEVSRQILNRQLQAALNTSGRGVPGQEMRVGDKIVCTKNGMFPAYHGGSNSGSGEDDESEGGWFVANGELGKVTDVREKLIVAKFENPPRMIKIPIGKQEKKDDSDDSEESGSAANFELGYCISGHKSQGSEWPIVLIVLDACAGARRVMSREWVYTAISRGKRFCLLVGRLQTAIMACQRVALKYRKTFLAERIQEQVPF